MTDQTKKPLLEVTYLSKTFPIKQNIGEILAKKEHN